MGPGGWSCTQQDLADICARPIFHIQHFHFVVCVRFKISRSNESQVARIPDFQIPRMTGSGGKHCESKRSRIMSNKQIAGSSLFQILRQKDRWVQTVHHPEKVLTGVGGPKSFEQKSSVSRRATILRQHKTDGSRLSIILRKNIDVSRKS